MGRKLIAPAVAVAVALGCTAGPAMASTTHAKASHTRTTMRTFSNGTHKVSRRAFERLAVRALAQPGNDSHVSVYRHSFRAECTVPVASSPTGYMNIYSSDTSDVTVDGNVMEVGTCSANLAKMQVGADKSDAGKPVSVPFSGKYTTAGYECSIAQPGGTGIYIGDEEAVVYPDGLYVSTCIAYPFDFFE